MDQEWLVRMLAERIDDRAFLGLIRKWLRAGILDTTGAILHPVTGTPQGGVVTPPTMLRTLLLGRMSVGVRTNPKHHRHFLFANLYTPYQRANNLPFHRPIRRSEIPLHLRHKFLELPDQ